jgi:hypothetical protein
MVARGASTPSWSDVTYYIPSDTSSTHLTGFTHATGNPNIVTSGFIFYGSVATHEDPDGQLETSWYALPYGTTGLWTLNWDAATDDSVDKVRITLKSTTPSTPPPTPPTGPSPPGTTSPLPSPPSRLAK